MTKPETGSTPQAPLPLGSTGTAWRLLRSVRGVGGGFEKEGQLRKLYLVPVTGGRGKIQNEKSHKELR